MFYITEQTENTKTFISRDFRKTKKKTRTEERQRTNVLLDLG